MNIAREMGLAAADYIDRMARAAINPPTPPCPYCTQNQLSTWNNRVSMHIHIRCDNCGLHVKVSEEQALASFNSFPRIIWLELVAHARLRRDYPNIYALLEVIQ